MDMITKKSIGVGFITSNLAIALVLAFSVLFLANFVFSEQPLQNNPPKILGYPDIQFTKNSVGKENFVNLYDYFSDDFDSVLEFELREQSNPTLINCFISKGNYLSCSAPTTNMSGLNYLKIRAIDSKGLFSEATYKVSVVKGQNYAPIISFIPEKSFKVGSSLDKIIDLWYYVSDEDADSLLSYSVISQTNSNVTYCDVLANRYLSCSVPRTEGINTVTVKVKDLDGAYSLGDVQIVVKSDLTNKSPVLFKINDVVLDNYYSSYSNAKIVADLRAIAYDAEDSFDSLSFSTWSYSDSDFSCYIDKPYLKCYSSRPNSFGPSLIWLQVMDTQGATSTIYFSIRGINNQYNRSPSLQGIPDLKVRENYPYSIRHVDLRNYVSDDNPINELEFKIVSQSRSDIIYCRVRNNYYFECDAPYRNKTGVSTITIEVMDMQGNKDDDTFFVEVFPELTNSCNDISVETYSVFMKGNERQKEVFRIRNNSHYDFRIKDIDLREDSQYLRIVNYDYDDKILSNDYSNLEIEFESDSTNYAREATGSIRIKGEFENGDVCSFSDISTYYYRIRINPDYSYSSQYCSDIKIITQDLSVRENSTTEKFFTLKNTSSRDFEITGLSISENSSYFNAKVERSFEEVRRNDEETFKVIIDSSSVTSLRAGDAEIRVSGRFSNGKYCSSSEIKKKFTIKVLDTSDNTEKKDNVETIKEPEIALSTGILSIFENETKPITATIKNVSNKTQCYRASSNSSNKFTSNVSNSNFCLAPGQSDSMLVRVSGRSSGSDTLELQVYYNNLNESITNSKSRFVNVEILKVQKPQATIDLELKSKILEGKELIVINTGDDLSNVRISVVDAPKGITFEDKSVSSWNKNEGLELKLKENSLTGKIKAAVVVESAEGTRAIPIEFEVPEKADLTTGFISLVAWPIAVLAGIFILVLAALGVLSIFSRKTN